MPQGMGVHHHEKLIAKNMENQWCTATVGFDSIETCGGTGRLKLILNKCLTNVAQEVGFDFVEKCGDIWRLKLILQKCWMKVAQEVRIDFIDLTSQHTIHSKINSLYNEISTISTYLTSQHTITLKSIRILLLLQMLSIESNVRTSVKSGDMACPLYRIKCWHPLWENKLTCLDPMFKVWRFFR